MAEISGKLNIILDKVSGTSKSGNDWVKQDFILETEGNYPKKVCFSLWGDKLDALSGINPGEQIKISFDPESREFNNKWYTELRVWKLETAGSAQSSAPKKAEESKQFPDHDPFTSDGDSEGDSDDLPF